MLFKLSTMAMVFTAVALGATALLSGSAQAGGGGCHSNSALTDGSATKVSMVKNCFGPMVARVDAGATVTFINEDPAPHTVTGAALLWGDTASMLQGDSREATFEEEGVYPYACILHPGMVGAIVVGDGIGESAAGEVRTTDVLVAGSSGASGAPSADSAPVAVASPADDDESNSTLMFAGGTAALVFALVTGAIGGARLVRRRVNTP